jgi:hypothetical protein
MISGMFIGLAPKMENGMLFGGVQSIARRQGVRLEPATSR